MSLLNKVLRDLDARRASDVERQQVPFNVKPLPSAAMNSSALPRRLMAIGLLLAVALIVLVIFQKFRTPEMPPIFRADPPATSLAVPIAESKAEVPALSATHELKLDMSSLKASDAVIERKTTETPIPKMPAALTSPPQKASGNVRGIPVTGMTSSADEIPSNSTGKVIVSAQPAAHNEADYRRALSMIEQGQNAEAESLLRQMLETDPSYHGARQSLFNLLAASGQQDAAAALLADGLRLNPANAQWAMNLARLQVERNDNAGAWETLKRTLPNAANQADYRAFCGTVLQRLNQPVEAASHYRAALRINPTEGRWWVGYALSLEADNKTAESREAFSRAQATGNLPPDLAAFVEGKLRK